MTVIVVVATASTHPMPTRDFIATSFHVAFGSNKNRQSLPKRCCFGTPVLVIAKKARTLTYTELLYVEKHRMYSIA